MVFSCPSETSLHSFCRLLCVFFSLLSFFGGGVANFLRSQGAPLAYDAARTLRFAVFGASMGPLGGAWNSAPFYLLPPFPLAHLPPSTEFLEVNFPLRPVPAHGRIPAAMTKVKVEQPPNIPGLPKNARWERAPNNSGAAAGEKSGPGVMQGEKEVGVSVAQLAKRVAADQLGMCVLSFPFFSLSLLHAPFRLFSRHLLTLSSTQGSHLPCHLPSLDVAARRLERRGDEAEDSRQLLGDSFGELAGSSSRSSFYFAVRC
jgi:hypothetical protein